MAVGQAFPPRGSKGGCRGSGRRGKLPTGPHQLVAGGRENGGPQHVGGPRAARSGLSEGPTRQGGGSCVGPEAAFCLR